MWSWQILPAAISVQTAVTEMGLGKPGRKSGWLELSPNSSFVVCVLVSMRLA